nr:MAG TPA: hypothetical protein [Caudoviricetes sp.]DAZ24356.1 MAG TPA: hypothetical protein [Caudoviricetes sp.]
MQENRARPLRKLRGAFFIPANTYLCTPAEITD